jgi:hypothetical protein
MGSAPGLVALVAKGVETNVFSVGTMTLGGEVPVRRDTIFRLASMTKPITSVAAMMLVEEGKLTLAEPIDRLAPGLGSGRRDVRRGSGLSSRGQRTSLNGRRLPRLRTAHDDRYGAGRPSPPIRGIAAGHDNQSPNGRTKGGRKRDPGARSRMGLWRRRHGRGQSIWRHARGARPLHGRELAERRFAVSVTTPTYFTRTRMGSAGTRCSGSA